MAHPAKRNRALRFPLQMPIHYRKSGMLHWHDGRTLNISRTGVLFHAYENLKTDLNLEISISLPKETTLTCQGTVVRTEPSVSTKAKTGIGVRINHCRLLSSDKAEKLFG